MTIELPLWPLILITIKLILIPQVSFDPPAPDFAIQHLGSRQRALRALREVRSATGPWGIATRCSLVCEIGVEIQKVPEEHSKGTWVHLRLR